MMGGKQDGSPARFGSNILDHEGCRCGIKPFRRFVENIDIRRCDKQTSNPQSPPFSTRETCSTISKLMVYSVRQICDCPLKTDRRQSAPQLIIAGVGPTQQQVVGDRTAEQFGSLQEITDTRAGRHHPRPRETITVEDTSPALRREQAGSERENRRLAAATWPNECDALARCYPQRHAFHDGLVFTWECKDDIVEFEAATRIHQLIFCRLVHRRMLMAE